MSNNIDENKYKELLNEVNDSLKLNELYDRVIILKKLINNDPYISNLRNEINYYKKNINKSNDKYNELLEIYNNHPLINEYNEIRDYLLASINEIKEYLKEEIN